MVFSDVPGSINGGIGPAMDGSGHVTTYLEVPDLEGMLARVASPGGTNIMEPMQVPGVERVGRSATVELELKVRERER
jgi:predicted enzyme related to lactoylglutathione lyase